jgi:hypothetical protein
MSDVDVLSRALPGPMQMEYWYEDGVAADLSKMSGQSIKLWRPEAYARDLMDALHAAGYSLRSDEEWEDREVIVRRAAHMGLCSQTHHEHLMRAALAAVNEALR